MDHPNLATIIGPSVLFSAGRDPAFESSFGIVLVVMKLTHGGFTLSSSVLNFSAADVHGLRAAPNDNHAWIYQVSALQGHYPRHMSAMICRLRLHPNGLTGRSFSAQACAMQGRKRSAVLYGGSEAALTTRSFHTVILKSVPT